MKATCPVHGAQEFARVEASEWWWCSQTWEECRSVIPDELVTPDGAEVIAWDPLMAWPIGSTPSAGAS